MAVDIACWQFGNTEKKAKHVAAWESFPQQSAAGGDAEREAGGSVLAVSASLK